jgi:hypothetical protein
LNKSTMQINIKITAKQTVKHRQILNLTPNYNPFRMKPVRARQRMWKLRWNIADYIIPTHEILLIETQALAGKEVGGLKMFAPIQMGALKLSHRVVMNV